MVAEAGAARGHRDRPGPVPGASRPGVYADPPDQKLGVPKSGRRISFRLVNGGPADLTGLRARPLLAGVTVVSLPASVRAGEAFSIEVDVDGSVFAPGTYPVNIEFSAAGAATKNVYLGALIIC